MAFFDVFLTVKDALKRSCSLMTLGKPDITMRSWVVWIWVIPVPKRLLPAVATATAVKLVRESFNGT